MLREAKASHKTRGLVHRARLLQDYALPSAHRLLHSHFDEAVAAWAADRNASAALAGAGSLSGVATQGLVHARPPAQGKAAGWARDVHWHAFDFGTLRGLLECLGLRVTALELVAPFHMVALATKPAAESGAKSKQEA